jgi:intracellular multiplication protein IcmL
MAKPKQEKLSVTDPLEFVFKRAQFYRKTYRRALVVFIASLVVNILLASLLLYIIYNPPTPVYFATNANGKVTPLFSLDEPNMSDAAVLEWAYKAAVASYTYSYVNYRGQIQAASGFFTGAGWKQYVDALGDTNNLKAVISKKLIVSAQAVAEPIILQKGKLNGRFAWMIEIPLLVSYQNNEVYTQANYQARLLIIRVPILNAPDGIGIEKIAVGPATGS